jgi:hypothetical protein
MFSVSPALSHDPTWAAFLALVALVVTVCQMLIARAVVRAARDYATHADQFQKGLRAHTEALLRSHQAELAIHESNRHVALQLIKLQDRMQEKPRESATRYAPQNA